MAGRKASPFNTKGVIGNRRDSMRQLLATIRELTDGLEENVGGPERIGFSD
jgi:hypothetical protein